MIDQYLKVYLIGQDGYRWNLTDETEGVLLRPGPSMLFDAPAKTFWIESSTGSHYQGHRFERRDPVFSVQIHGADPLIWADIDSRFRRSLGMVGEDTFKLEFHTPYGIRWITMRLLTEPTAYATADYEKKSPWLTHDSTLAISAACENPFWEADPVELEWELPSGTSGGTNLMFENKGDVPVFWKGFVTAPGTWTLPDRSWGQKIYAKNVPPYHRGIDDANRTVPLPDLVAGEDTDIDTHPDEPTLIAHNGALVQARWNSNGFLYPLRPYLEPTAVPVSVTGATAGAAVKIWIPRWYSRPWGATL
ncbi:hypothetical protein [Nocardia otitidiscaviarum]|uniref:hypothetical protein n=1 Tax=Nocardia otitidiscaviarum TaxID=1823 RepID=UPI0004A72F8C|nr:hypothetical protein [Nocardia otitidiscaviarum]